MGVDIAGHLASLACCESNTAKSTNYYNCKMVLMTISTSRPRVYVVRWSSDFLLCPGHSARKRSQKFALENSGTWLFKFLPGITQNQTIFWNFVKTSTYLTLKWIEQAIVKFSQLLRRACAPFRMQRQHATYSYEDEIDDANHMQSYIFLKYIAFNRASK